MKTILLLITFIVCHISSLHAFNWNFLSGEKGSILSLSATSSETGFPVKNVLDKNNNTYWSPKGTPQGEGLTLTFTEPIEIEDIVVQTMELNDSFSMELYLDGAYYTGFQANKANNISLKRKASSLFIRITDKTQESVKIKEILIVEKSKSIKVPSYLTGSVTASSTLEPRTAYAPELLFDNRNDFGWVEGSKGDGENETISIHLQSPVDFDSLYIVNGYQRSEEHYKSNNRLKDFELSADSKLVGKYTLSDVMGAQKIPLNKNIKAQSLTLTVKSIYKGTKYKDLVLSEIKLGSKGQIMLMETDFLNNLSIANTAALRPGTFSTILDRYLSFEYSDYSDWNNIQIKLRSNGSFVAWFDSKKNNDDNSKAEQKVMDGNWLLEKFTPGALKVKIFGKMHSTSEQRSYENPYSDPDYVDQTKIFSDFLTITPAINADFVESGSMVSAMKSYIAAGSADQSFFISGKTILGIFPAVIEEN